MNPTPPHHLANSSEETSHARSFVPWLVWGIVAMVTVSVAGVFATAMLGAKRHPLPTYGDVPDFALTNQAGRTVTKADLAGNIWVAGIIFTRCPGPCLDMTRRMKAIQDALPPGSPVRLLSLTADPEFDTPSVLREYAARFGAEANRWYFLTGSKREIYELATSGLKLAVQENIEPGPGEDPFLHSTRLVIIDGRGKLRGFSSDDAVADTAKEMLAAARALVQER
jgi:protein SCO1/2